MKPSVLTLLIFLIMLIGCKKDKKAPPAVKPNAQENILNLNAHVIDTSAITGKTANSITLNQTNSSYTPAIGDILIGSPSSKSPMGLLVKITSISKAGNTFTCGTEESNLNDAFKQLNINYTYNNSFDGGNIQLSSTRKMPDSFSSLESKAFAANTGGSILSVPFLNYILADGLTFNGDLRLNIPQTIIKYVKAPGSLLPDTAIVSASFNTSGSTLEITGRLAQIPELSFDLPVELPNILVPVPIGPAVVLIPFSQKVVLKILPASISGKMKFTIRPQMNASLGMSYINGTFTNTSTQSSLGVSADTLIRNNFDLAMIASATILNPSYQISPYGFDDENLYFSIPNDLNLTIQTDAPNYSLKYKLGVAVGINLLFWTGLTINKSLDASLYETTILQGNWKYKIGDRAFGGIVAYVDSTSRHGIVVDTVDLATNIAQSQFYEDADDGGSFPGYITYPTLNPDSLSSGQYLTNVITKLSPANKIALLCKNYKSGKVTGWFLPSPSELSTIYQSKNILKISSDDYYTSLPTGINLEQNISQGGLAYIDFSTGTVSYTMYMNEELETPVKGSVRAIKIF